VLIISADAMMGRYMKVMGRWNYIFGHRPTGDVPGIPDGQSAPGCSMAGWALWDSNNSSPLIGFITGFNV
jgi:hypothetical protein